MKCSKIIRGALAVALGLFVSASYAQSLASENFEAYELDKPIAGNGTWLSGEGDLSIVTTNSAVNDTKVLKVATDGTTLTNTFTSTVIGEGRGETPSTVYMDADVLFVPSEELTEFDVQGESGNEDLKLGLYAYKPEGAENARLVVFHSYMDEDGLIQVTNDVISEKILVIPTNRAVKVEVHFRYYSMDHYLDGPVTAFCVSVDGKVVTSPFGYTHGTLNGDNDLAGTYDKTGRSGHMFLLANQQNSGHVQFINSISALNVSGTGYLDNFALSDGGTLPTPDDSSEPAPFLEIGQAVPATASVGATVPVSFKLENIGDAPFQGNAQIRFGESNQDRALTLAFIEGHSGSEVTEADLFLGYDVPVDIPAGGTVTIKANATATAAKDYRFTVSANGQFSATATMTASEPELAVVQTIPATASINEGVPVSFELKNNGAAPFDGVAKIRFGDSNTDKKLTLTFGASVDEVKEQEAFLGYDVPVNIPAGGTVTINATATATVAKDYLFTTTIGNQSSGPATMTVSGETPPPSSGYAAGESIKDDQGNTVVLTPVLAAWLNGILGEGGDKAAMDEILENGDGDSYGLEVEYLLNSNPTEKTEVSFKLDSIVIGADAKVNVTLTRTEKGVVLPTAINGTIAILSADAVDGTYGDAGSLDKGTSEGIWTGTDPLGAKKFFKAELR